MTHKKRTAKPRKVVTDATKAKLPKPKRTRKPDAVQDAYKRSVAANSPRSIPCGEDVLVTGVSHSFGTPPSETMTFQFLLDPPHGINLPAPTQPQPWPVRVLNWLDEAPTKARRKVAAWLRALAGRLDA